MRQSPAWLRATFQHLPGIGPGTERGLWTQGIRDWADFGKVAEIPGFSGGRLGRLREELGRSERALENADSAYFAARLPQGEHWRLYPDFHPRTAFLDIETTGFSPRESLVTCVTVHGGGRTRTLIQGEDLEELGAVLRPFALLVTFNGRQFDVPFLSAHFPHLRFPPAHADLRWVFQRQGLTGGLKAIERQLELGSRKGVEEVDGWEAVRLWYAHCRGVEGALERLVAYNRADTVNLEVLMDHAVGEMDKRYMTALAEG